jgi:hypothetical protein
VRTIRIISAFVLMLGLSTQLASAQSSATGTLTGVVKDANGGVLPGVSVTAAQPQTGLTRLAPRSCEPQFPVDPAGP